MKSVHYVDFNAHTIYTLEAGEDFIEVEMDVLFPAQMDSVIVEVPLGPDDIFPGEDKVFEVYLGASPGVFVSPTAHVDVIIVDPDPPLPGWLQLACRSRGLHCSMSQ